MHRFTLLPKCTKVLFSSLPHQHVNSYLFENYHPNRCEGIAPCPLDFPDDYCC